MRISILMAGAAAIALAYAPAAGAAVTIHDAVQVVSGGQTVSFTSTDESHEFFSALQAVLTPTGFQDGTVFLDEPPGEPGAGGFSDAFTLVSNNGHLDIYFISDGASAAEQSAFVTAARQIHLVETGKWQDVSSFYNQGAGFAQILSDIPEPGTWALMLLGFAGVGLMTRRRRPCVAA